MLNKKANNSLRQYNKKVNLIFKGLREYVLGTGGQLRSQT